MKNVCTRVVVLLLVHMGLFTDVLAQRISPIWQTIEFQRLDQKHLLFRKTIPSKAVYFKLNMGALQQSLKNTPQRHAKVHSEILIDFPNAKGHIETYRVVEASVMTPKLQTKYPSIKSYTGVNTSNPQKQVRFSITSQGIHAMFLNPGKSAEFIDPYTKNNNQYIVYAKKDLPTPKTAFVCHTITDDMSTNGRSSAISDQWRDTGDGQLRTFRIAIATTVEYSRFHWTQAGLSNSDSEASKKEAVLNAIVVTLTRNNFLYERDLSLTMQLIADNEDIIFISNDNFTNDNSGLLINESQQVIDNIIGNANYDIGHTFSTGGGGLAQLRSPCFAGSKARGITGLPNPVGDPFDIDFVAHELGHQFGAPHTFNGASGNCGGSRDASNAYEVGSGTTIMAYAGICGSDNVQYRSDPYFHQKSLQMMWDNITTFSTCATRSATGNGAPTANAGTDYTIPSRTPYKLTGLSTDAESTSTHTYTWEQYDLGPAGVPSVTTSTGPLVRSFEGTADPVRYIPRLADLYTSNGGSTDWEILTAISRAINFRLTVRDNHIGGGRTAVDAMRINTVAGAGPFLVTSQSTSQIVWVGGQTEVITWDVAGTTANGINATTVNILLSTDGGETYTETLASNVPNDGSHTITVPNISASLCRIMVEATNTIFFNVNNRFFAIEEGTLSLEEIDENDTFTIHPNPNTGTFNITYKGLDGDVLLEVYDMRGRKIVSQTYAITGVLDESVHIHTVNTGVYFVRLSDGQKTVSKRVIIQ